MVMHLRNNFTFQKLLCILETNVCFRDGYAFQKQLYIAKMAMNRNTAVKQSQSAAKYGHIGQED